MAETIGEWNDGFLMELQSAGYTAETIVLAELTPQIQIAWADGAVSRRERDVIVESAAHRRVPPQSLASLQLAQWMERRPSEDFFRISREVIGRMLRRLEEGFGAAARHRNLYGSVHDPRRTLSAEAKRLSGRGERIIWRTQARPLNKVGNSPKTGGGPP